MSYSRFGFREEIDNRSKYSILKELFKSNIIILEAENQVIKEYQIPAVGSFETFLYKIGLDKSTAEKYKNYAKSPSEYHFAAAYVVCLLIPQLNKHCHNYRHDYESWFKRELENIIS